jgi:hypothetical protein
MPVAMMARTVRVRMRARLGGRLTGMRRGYGAGGARVDRWSLLPPCGDTREAQGLVGPTCDRDDVRGIHAPPVQAEVFKDVVTRDIADE